MSVEIKINLNIDAIRQQAQDKFGTVVGKAATEGRKIARGQVHIDTGFLQDSIAEGATKDPMVWTLGAYAPYAIYEELRHPFLLDAALQVKLAKIKRGIRFGGKKKAEWKTEPKSNKQRGGRKPKKKRTVKERKAAAKTGQSNRTGRVRKPRKRVSKKRFREHTSYTGEVESNRGSQRGGSKRRDTYDNRSGGTTPKK